MEKASEDIISLKEEGKRRDEDSLITQKNTVKKIIPNYRYIKQESVIQTIRKFVPREFVPTNKMAVVLGIIFLAVVVLALVQFPFDQLLSGNPDVVVRVGYPYPFLELGVLNMGTSPVRVKNSIIDIILYVLLSYAVDVLLNFIMNIRLVKSEEEKKEIPEIFKKPNPNVSDAITKKIFSAA